MSQEEISLEGRLRRSWRKKRPVPGLTDEPLQTKRRQLPLKSSLPLTSEVQELTTQEGPFCKQCASIDFEQIFSSTRVRSRKGLSILEIGLMKGDDMGRGCAMCQFFYQMRVSRGHGAAFHLRAHSSFTILTDSFPKSIGDIALTIEPGSGLTETYSSSTVHKKDYGFVVPEFTDTITSPSFIFQGRQVFTDRINYTQLRDWLLKCHMSHPETCGVPKSGKKMSLLCIDCNTRDLIDLDTSAKYVALSYVLGASSASQMAISVGQSDLKRLPTTGVSNVIEDAITVVKNLGLQYLWVDQYCIDQQDFDIRKKQIRNMDLVYQQAYATIIASAGRDAMTGLSGVTSELRKKQPSVVIRNMRLLSTLPSLETVLKGSPWMSRGWTYQEFTLSKRCLFFTDVQVYFVCSAMISCESTVSGLDNNTVASNAEEGMLGARIFGVETPGPSLRQLADHIMQYSGRNLTFGSDALDAFRGILARSRFWTYYGIPIAHVDTPDFPMSREDLDIGFARGLYWIPQRLEGWNFLPLSRRSYFPSWSWAGWKGAIAYPSIYGPAGANVGGLMKANRSTCDTKFWVEDEAGKAITLEELCDPLLDSRSIVELSNFIYVEAWTLLLRFQPAERHWTGKLNLNICNCHLDTKHDKGEVTWTDRWETVILLDPPSEKDEYYHRLTNQLWTCVLLYSGIHDGWKDNNLPLHNLMVVDWEGDTAYRVGAITVRGQANSFLLDLPVGTRRRIRLG